MKLLQSLVEMSKTSSGIIVPDDVARQLDKAAQDSPEAVIELVRTLAKQGHVDEDTLKELRTAKDVIDRLLQAAKSGQVDVQKPEAGSFYSDQKKRMEQPSENQKIFDAMKRRTAYAIKQNNPELVKKMNYLLMTEFSRRRKGANQ